MADAFFRRDGDWLVGNDGALAGCGKGIGRNEEFVRTSCFNADLTLSLVLRAIA